MDENQKQFRHGNGGIMNWYASTGSIHFQGKLGPRESLQETVGKLLASGGPDVQGDKREAHDLLVAPSASQGGEPSPADNPPTSPPEPATPRKNRVLLGPPFVDSELVIGLVGAVGTELDKVVRILEQRLPVHNYEVQHVRISHDIIPQIVSVPDPQPADEYERIKGLMQAGNDARSSAKDNSILALGAASLISSLRARGDGDEGKRQHAPRRAYIINSLKHPEEVRRLRDIYPQGFYLLGIHSDEQRREDYLVNQKRIREQHKVKELIGRDEDEHLPHGQRVADTYHLSDFFVRLDGHDDSLRNSLWRILALLFGDPYKTPTFDEYAMFMAFVAALRSADLSRQVGAVIAKSQEIIATGANDCPRFHGGLYWPEFNEQAHDIKDAQGGRDYTRGKDSNKVEQQAIIDDIIKDTAATGVSEELLRKSLEKSRIRDLTEFGRVVHAEMEALLSCARSHASTIGATLYCTTFPCHNCAKHVIAAGINRVVYIEPYQKSKAIEFHDDAINAGFRFEPFVGVGPRRFFDLFSMRLGSGYALKRKDEDGHTLEWKPETSHLRLQMLPSTYLDLELLASNMFHAARQKEDFPDGQ